MIATMLGVIAGVVLFAIGYAVGRGRPSSQYLAGLRDGRDSKAPTSS